MTWRPTQFEGYEVSDAGQVRSYRYLHGGLAPVPQRTLSPGTDSHGYFQVGLYQRGKAHTQKVHSLVAEAFIGPRPEGMEVNHKDGDKKNNAVANLEYVTSSGNRQHAFATGLQEAPRGEKHGRCVLSEETVAEIRALYAAGATQKELALRFGVAQGTISRIVNYKRRKKAA